jgi:hypothetical protein
VVYICTAAQKNKRFALANLVLYFDTNYVYGSLMSGKVANRGISIRERVWNPVTRRFLVGQGFALLRDVVSPDFVEACRGLQRAHDKILPPVRGNRFGLFLLNFGDVQGHGRIGKVPLRTALHAILEAAPLVEATRPFTLRRVRLESPRDRERAFYLLRGYIDDDTWDAQNIERTEITQALESVEDEGAVAEDAPAFRWRQGTERSFTIARVPADTASEDRGEIEQLAQTTLTPGYEGELGIVDCLLAGLRGQ